MALKATIRRAEVTLANVDRDCYRDLRVIVAQHPSETAARMLARLLAYVLRYDDALGFGRGVSTRDEPDLWLHAPDGRVREWIDVGLPDPERLLKASRVSQRVTLFATGAGFDRWRASNLARLAERPNISVAHLDPAFLDELASRLERSIRWSLTLSGGVVFLEMAGEQLETVPERVLGDPLA